MPSNYPLDLYRGDTHRWQFRFWADAAKTSAIDLTDAVVASEIRANSGSVVTVLACAVTLPNVIDVELSAADSQTLTTAPARWDLQLTWPTGEVQTPVGGAVTLQLDATV